MRIDIPLIRFGWLERLDCRKLIIIAFLSRLIFASFYDAYVSAIGTDPLLPDSTFYLARGRCVSALFNGYRGNELSSDIMLGGYEEKKIFKDIWLNEEGRFTNGFTENNFFGYIIGFIYFIFGYFPLGARIFNISLSILSSYLLYRVARRRIGIMTAKLFLLIALFLPTQAVYSITISRDFLRLFIISLIIWVIYG